MFGRKKRSDTMKCQDVRVRIREGVVQRDERHWTVQGRVEHDELQRIRRIQLRSGMQQPGIRRRSQGLVRLCRRTRATRTTRRRPST